MYDAAVINRLLNFIKKQNGLLNKTQLANTVQEAFQLTKSRSVYHNDSFGIRFSSSKSKTFSNTVLGLSVLKKYDDKPFIACLVTPTENLLYLANTTFLKKVSHSSHDLRVDNIRGSFNGGDIMRDVDGLENKPENFEELFASHTVFSFEENVARIVEANDLIKPTTVRFVPNEEEVKTILASVERAQAFLKSQAYKDMETELEARVDYAKDAILTTAQSENVNIRGRAIEYLITMNKQHLSMEVMAELSDPNTYSYFFTADELGDFHQETDDYKVEVDIKSKMLYLSSNPKGYNIDKLLRFLAEEKSVYLIFIVAVDEKGMITTKLCSIFNTQLLEVTKIRSHWAGRSSRGVTQYYGKNLEEVVTHFDEKIDVDEGKTFLRNLLALS